MLLKGRENNLVWDQRKKGHYEVYFLGLHDPKSKTGFGLRFSLKVPLDGTPLVEIWGFFFNRREPEKNFVIKNSLEWSRDQIRENPFLFEPGPSRISNTQTQGEIKGDFHTLTWDLSWEDQASPLYHLPYPWMYQRPFPRTKILAPHPKIKLSGKIQADGQTFQLQEVPGFQSHLWGKEYAESWVWAHCSSFVEEEAYFEGLSVRIRTGPFVLPPVTLFFLHYRNHTYFLNSMAALLKNRSRSYIGLWRFWGEGEGIRLEGEATALLQWILGAKYTGPWEEKRWSHNTKVGDLRLRILEKKGKGWNPLSTLTAQGSCALEWVEKTPDPRILNWV